VGHRRPSPKFAALADSKKRRDEKVEWIGFPEESALGLPNDQALTGGLYNRLGHGFPLDEIETAFAVSRSTIHYWARADAAGPGRLPGFPQEVLRGPRGRLREEMACGAARCDARTPGPQRRRMNRPGPSSPPPTKTPGPGPAEPSGPAPSRTLWLHVSLLEQARLLWEMMSAELTSPQLPGH